jgi:hypothetical protein
VFRRPAAMLLVLSLAVLALALVPAVGLAKGGGGGSKPGGGGGGKPGGGSCAQATPYVKVDNTWAWGQTGSFGTPGQSLTYSILVVNYDQGCGSTSFVVDVSAPSGFSVSMPTNTINLSSASQGYLWATLTSPGGATDGDYPLVVSVSRAGSPQAASYTSYYKIYSSDDLAPTLYWPSPGDGATISGRTSNVAVSANDDHRMKTIMLSIDGVAKTTAACDGVSYSCQLNYNWSTSRGQHTATFTATDWMGNVTALSTTFTVS